MTQRYLLDSNVVYELRKPRPHGGVVAWLESLEDAQLYVSAVTLGEIQAGIELTREQDLQKAQENEAWLAMVSVAYNVLPMDAAAFTAWAKLMHRKSDTLYEDAMIAATAKVHGSDGGHPQCGRLSGAGVGGVQPFCDCEVGALELGLMQSVQANSLNPCGGVRAG